MRKVWLAVCLLALVAIPADAQQTKINIYQTIVTLSAGVSNNGFLLARTDRTYVLIENIGASSATIAPGNGPVTAGQGLTLDGPSGTATQGGVITWTSGDIPANAFSAISTSGTTLLVWEGRIGQ